MNKSITDILNAHDINGWDKQGGTDKGTIHSYIEVYENLLSPFINKNCTLLEIGVWHGGSSLLWHEYLPKATIVGIDIENQIHESLFHKFSNRYNFYELNAYTDNSVSEIKNRYPGFDIIIEDGIHTEDSNKFAIENYLPMLNKGGVMIIEDLPINTSIEIPFGYSIKNPNLVDGMKKIIPIGYAIEIIDLTQVKGRYDDILMVIKKQ